MEALWTNLTNTFENLSRHTGKWWIVTPFLTTLPPIDQLSGAKIVIRGTVTDFLEGVSSIQVVQELLAYGAEVRTIPNLNAKVYMREGRNDATACFGSANLTRGGMKNNIEVMSSPSVVTEEFMNHLRQLWDSAHPMTSQEVLYLDSMIGFSKPWLKKPQKFEAFREVGARLKSVEDLVAESFFRISELFNGSEYLPETFLTGFRELDLITGGLDAGMFTIIAGRPSMGKTSLALTMASHCFLRQKRPVLFFSLEMSALQITTRLKSSEARVDMSRLRNGHLSDRDFQRLADVAGRLVEAPLFIDETSGLSLEELAIQARLFAQEHPSFLLIVDYLQIMSGGSKSWQQESRHQELGRVSRGLKNLARELEVPIIAISQLSRAVESRPNKRPILSDLRESGQLEEDADLVLFIYRDEYYDPHSEKQGIAEIVVAKQRNGPIGTVELLFHNRHIRFDDLTKP